MLHVLLPCRSVALLFSISLFGLAAAQSLHAADSVTLTPAIVLAGSPELVRVVAPGATAVDGEWIGHPLEFFRGQDGRTWFALAGVDVEAAAGPSTLKINVKTDAGAVRQMNQAVEIHEAHYRTGTLTVAPQFVEPGPEAMKVIEAEVALKQRVFAQSAAEPLWSGDFRAPVTAQATDSFGTRRMFNGKLASVHKGMDFRARMGTLVRAGNNGTVVLARKLYFEGNCVVIDHGMGLYTISMHLSRIDVHEGERVTKGQRLGLSGATGRVTGPHLHWAVRWEGAYLDPAKLLRMNLSGVR
ncbi:MAG TPA: M23 family metallopeptidase [Terracidiphilus sp.]|nr:M23 family metallopeptidase [Terracidiphilus sp.]